VRDTQVLDRVTVEITAEDVMTIALEVGQPVSPAQAAEFVRDGERAHKLWKQMVEAARQYVASSLGAEQSRSWWSFNVQSNKEYDA